jgi:hypothetical protein
LLGARPQTPWVGFAEVWVANRRPRTGTTLFASFSGKRRILALNWFFSWAVEATMPSLGCHVINIKNGILFT